MNDYIIISHDAFNKAIGEEGWSYQPADEIIKQLQKIAVKHFWIDANGNAVYTKME